MIEANRKIEPVVEERLTIQIPVQGWRQFLTARTEMLNAFDQAREKARSNEVEVLHGRVAEAEFRKWLGEFLPKRYGVTSGYIVSTGLKSTQKAPHFDVIIYDQLEAPILWIEDSPDMSSQGRSLAIPAEHVRCVIEVKSALTPAAVDHAIEHLGDLLPLMKGIDPPGERYKLHLPSTFCCAVVFFEVKKEHERSMSCLAKLNAGAQLRRFFGGIVLRGEGHSRAVTGRISPLQSKEPIEVTSSNDSLLTGMPISKSTQVTEEVYVSMALTWIEPHFAQFAFDLIAMMQGIYQSGYVSSFHGFGTTEWEERALFLRKPAQDAQA